MKKIRNADIESYYEDAELVRRMLAKDCSALESIYQKYAERLTCFIQIFVDCRDDVQDILQNTFVAALDSLEHYQGTSQFFTWMCGIARHKIGDYLRAKQKDTNFLEGLANTYWRQLERDNSRSVEERLLDQELSLEVKNIVGMMPEHYQRLLVEKYVHRKTVKQLAASRTMTEKAVESLLTRARRMFRTLVDQNDYFEGGESHE